jgi:uncharacterized protein YdhG (YjbR/CyaY superfamily)
MTCAPTDREVGGSVKKTESGVVDAYIAKQPAQARPVLQRVRRIIRRVLPGAEETISYQIPSYRLHGRYVVYFAGWKQHWSLYPVTEGVRAAVGADLGSYAVSKGTVRFPLAEPLPAGLVERIVRELAKAAEKWSRSKTAVPGKQGGPRGRAAR